MSDVFVELADTMIDDFDLIEFLSRLSSYVVDLLPADEAGVIIADAQGRLHPMASSSEAMTLLELFELQADDGPCLDAHRSGRAVVNVVLADAGERWPHFAVHARREGFSIVHALPMRLRGRAVGAINVFSKTPAHLDAPQVRLGQALADVATIGILQERAVSESRILAEQLQHALTARVVIEQAKGVLAERLGLDMPAAFELLRRHARSTSEYVSDTARRIVSGELSADALR